MKHFIFFTVVICAVLLSSAQNPEPAISEENVEETLQKIVENEYVRIPRKDFDAIIENRISNEVNNKFNFLLVTLGSVFGLLSVFSLVQTKRSKDMLREYVESQLSVVENRMKQDIVAGVDKELTTKTDQITMKMETEDVKIRKDIELVKNEVEAKLQSVELKNEQTVRQVNRAEDYMTNIEIDSLEKKFKERKYLKNIEEQGVKLLSDIKQSETHMSKIPFILGNFVSYLYANNTNDTDDLLLQLIEKYGKDFELHYNTYVNGGLTSFNKYLRYGTARNHREKALQYLNKSLQIQDTYGVALALKLQIYMMDYQRAVSEEIKKDSLYEAEKVLIEILDSSDKAPSYETINRLVVDYRIKHQRKYIEMLYQHFKEPLERMLERANELTSTNPKLIKYKLSDFTNVPPEEDDTASDGIVLNPD